MRVQEIVMRVCGKAELAAGEILHLSLTQIRRWKVRYEGSWVTTDCSDLRRRTPDARGESG